MIYNYFFKFLVDIDHFTFVNLSTLYNDFIYMFIYCNWKWKNKCGTYVNTIEDGEVGNNDFRTSFNEFWNGNRIRIKKIKESIFLTWVGSRSKQ